MDQDQPEKNYKRAIASSEVENLKLAVASFYDAQKLRIQMSNRLESQLRLSTMSVQAEAKLRAQLILMETVESLLLKDTNVLLKGLPVWKGYLKTVTGIGPTLAGVLISEIKDISVFETVSGLWAYCGFKVSNETGIAPRRVKGEKIRWNPTIKAKLMEVVGKSFIKCKNEKYVEIYQGMKTRLMNRPCWKPRDCHSILGQDFRMEIDSITLDGETGRKVVVGERVKKAKTYGETPLANGCTVGHVEIRSRRYMIKMFLADFWEAWRGIEGLECGPSYAEEKLGIVHH